MTKLNEIPVHVEVSSDQMPSESSSMLIPIMNQMVIMLETLMSSGESDILDLRHEPLDLEEIAALKDLLGNGEINADINTLGSTNIRETGISGVWWITHFNQENNIIGEFIEITTCPEMFKTYPEELKSSLDKLRVKVSQYTHPSATPEEIAQRLKELGFCSNNGVPSSLN